jgi:hypothetical protein
MRAVRRTAPPPPRPHTSEEELNEDAADADDETLRRQFEIALGIPELTNTVYNIYKLLDVTRPPELDADGNPVSRLDKIDIRTVAMDTYTSYANTVKCTSADGTACRWAAKYAAALGDDFHLEFCERDKLGNLIYPLREKPMPTHLGHVSSPRWWPSLLAMERWGIFRRATDLSIPRSFSPYFETDKTPTTSRSIVHAIAANATAPTPRHVALICPKMMLHLLAFFPKPFVSCVDARHQFHSASTEHLPSIPKWFSIGCMDPATGELAVFEAIRLVMGFKGSTIRAQNLSWVCALHHPGPDPFTFHAFASDPDTPPPYVAVKDATGTVQAMIFVLYDNVGYICRSDAVRLALNSRYEANAKMMGVTIKIAKKHPTAEAVNPKGYHAGFEVFNHGECAFLGFMFQITDTHVLSKHADVNQWRDVAEPPSGPFCARTAGRFGGIAVWDSTASAGRKPLCEYAGAIQLLRHKKIETLPKKWGNDITLSEEERALWISTMATIFENKPNIWSKAELNKPPPVIRSFLSSDACTSWGYGATWFREDGTLLADLSVKWLPHELVLADGVTPTPVYHLEVVAAIRAVEWLHNHELATPDDLAAIYMAQDNRAAKAGFDRLYSARDDTNVELARFAEKLRKWGHRIFTLWVPSDSMSADETSRNKETSAARTAACAALLRSNPVPVSALQKLAAASAAAAAQGRSASGQPARSPRKRCR